MPLLCFAKVAKVVVIMFFLLYILNQLINFGMYAFVLIILAVFQQSEFSIYSHQF